VWGVVDPGFNGVAFDLLAVMADVCVVMRREGKGTGQIDWVPTAADVPVVTEKKLNSPRCQARFTSQTAGYLLTALWINNHGFDTDHRHRHQHRGGMLTKTPPPTELQIPATVTTLYY